MEKEASCCICGEKLEGQGNEAWPVVNDGTCCDKCNAAFVIPARFAKMNLMEGDKSKCMSSASTR